MPRLTVPSPIGALTLTEANRAITALHWAEPDSADIETDQTPLLLQAASQIDAYFFCELKYFELPLAPAGTPFQKAVWNAMLQIPRGAVRSYGEIAHDLDGASAQAVGSACGANPIPLLIPCHRVVAAGGGLGGYSGRGGVDTKRWLLAHEGWHGTAQRDLFELRTD